MPTLADIYSAINIAKRKASDIIQNPGTSLEQMIGYANDRARNFNQLGRQSSDAMMGAIKSGQPMGQDSATQQLMDTYESAYNPIGMTVFHGSPHVFEKFDISKLGTGEGAQSYGKGLYFAQSPEVAKNYQIATSKDKYLTQNGLFDPSDLEHLNVKATLRKDGLDKAIEIAKKYAEPDLDYPDVASKAARDLQKLQTIKDSGGLQTNLGAFYKVDLPDTHIRRMLDWDSPLKNQPKPVRNLAKSLGMDLNDLGGDLIGKIGKGEQGKQILQEAGIPGIKYLDQSSRDAKTGTRNFVVFDPNHLNILERNNQPIK